MFFNPHPLVPHNAFLALYRLEVLDEGGNTAVGYTFPLTPSNVKRTYVGMGNHWDVQSDPGAPGTGITRQIDWYGNCYSSDTEVLTKRGWLSFDQVVLSDEIATRSKEKEFEWQKPTAIINKPYSGEMYHFHSQGLDLLVTPDHRMLLSKIPLTEERGLLRSPEHSRKLAQSRCGKLYYFQGEDRTIGEIARLVGLRRETLGRRLYRGMPLDQAILSKKAKLSDPRDLPIRYKQVYFSHQNYVPVHDRNHFEYIEKAKDISLEDTDFEYHIPTASIWKGTEIDSFEFSKPKITCPSKNVNLTGDQFCALMGMYIAEGNIRPYGGIEIAQQSASKGFEPYKAFLMDVFGKVHWHGKTFAIPRRALNAYFKQFGKAHEKFIPEEIMNATPRQIEIFLYYYGLGDGCNSRLTHKTGLRTTGERISTNWRYTTVSKQLADQLTELLQKSGRSASVREEMGGQQWILGNMCNVRRSYIITERRRASKKFKIGRQNYSGNVGCVTVPNGIIYVRRNGNPAWSGNSSPVWIIEGTTGYQIPGHISFGASSHDTANGESGVRSASILNTMLHNFSVDNANIIAGGGANLRTMRFFDYYRSDFWNVMPLGEQTYMMDVARPLLVNYRFRLVGTGDVADPLIPEEDAIGNAFRIGPLQAANDFLGLGALLGAAEDIVLGV